MTSAPPIHRDKRSGVYTVRLNTPHGIRRISTGARTREEAEAMCDAALIEKLQMAANAGVLNANAIQVLTTGRKMTCADVLEAWLAEAEIDLAPDTMSGYVKTLKLFMKHDEIGKKPIMSLVRPQLDQFINAPDASAATRRHRRAALRHFFGFANSAAYCVGNLALRVKMRVRDLKFHKIEQKPVYPITHEEYLRIMGNPVVTGFFRWATALGYWLGLRFRDIAGLEWASLQQNRIVIHTRKRGVRVSLPLDNPLIGSDDLKKIIAEINEQLPEATRDPIYCFPKELAFALSPTKRATLSTYYARVLTRSGIKGKCFHGLRHSAACRLDKAGMTIEEIGEVLGHADNETTYLYLNEQTSLRRRAAESTQPLSPQADAPADEPFDSRTSLQHSAE